MARGRPSKQTVEDHVTHQVIVGEVAVAKENKKNDDDDFMSYVDMMDSIRTDKEYDWMSDVSIPEFAAEMLAQQADDVMEYFQTRDFVEVYLEDEGDEAKKASEANKELINRTLNCRSLHHPMKFLRARLINNLGGRVYGRCGWIQKTKVDVVGYDEELQQLDVDVYGEPLNNPFQIPKTEVVEVPVMAEVPVVDKFTYDIWDQRNVFTDNSYTYSIQDKEWITLRSEMTLEELKAVADSAGYFNLDKLGKPPERTETADTTYNEDDQHQPISSSLPKPFDVYERYGLFWVDGQRDEEGQIVEGTERPGLNASGEPTKNALLQETIITIATADRNNTLIGFKLNPFKDATGKTYKPIVRGLCYIHPTRDAGVGDGQYCRELQVAIDDTFNISQDRVMLATLPTFKYKKYAHDDNTSLYFEPGHGMECENPRDDIMEFQISDNIGGALSQLGMLVDKMRQLTGKSPLDMSQVPEMASTTATAVSQAQRASGGRSKLKSMVFEYTFLTELYWMVTQMTYQFAKEETAYMLMGDRMFDFDPSREYWYKPLSQSIETDQSKWQKRQEWTQILQAAIQIGHPDTVRIVNYILGEIFKLMGGEFQNFGNKFFREEIPIEQNQGGAGTPAAGPGMPVSNQNMMPMSAGEQQTREVASAGYR